MYQGSLTVETTVHTPVGEVWNYWTEPQHITKWCYASDDWHAPNAENDLRVGGRFLTRMEAKDGSFGFDFGGVYDEVRINEFFMIRLFGFKKQSFQPVPLLLLLLLLHFQIPHQH
ncbi:SRPBCC domain-containing protein [Paenibacillus sp. FA6]|uniref:SRPBCC domain-containing protein n=1 Tax=Paenibacillus sp. FA6 TaxID=3413029 RepID=UPI003F657436